MLLTAGFSPPFVFVLHCSRFGNIFGHADYCFEHAHFFCREASGDRGFPQPLENLGEGGQVEIDGGCAVAAPKAKILGERARFEVAGGNFRMIVAFNFAREIAFIKFIGTHAEYDRIDALKVSQF